MVGFQFPGGIKGLAAWSIAALAIGALPFSSIAAADGPAQEPYVPGWREVWGGADVSSHAWLIYSGITVSPYSNVYEDGLRLRVTGGYGGYVYVGERRTQQQTFNARTSYAEGLVGYQKRFGPVTAKGFVGISAIEHEIEPFDPENPVQGQKIGPKIAAELWINMGEQAWGQADLAWTSAHNTASARVRTGYRIWGDASIGLEGAIYANDLGEDVRAGLFTRYAWQGGEFSIAGGYAGRFLDEADMLRDPYTTATLLLQF